MIEKPRITCSSKNSVSETTVIAMSGMLDRGFVNEQQ